MWELTDVIGPTHGYENIFVYTRSRVHTNPPYGAIPHSIEYTLEAMEMAWLYCATIPGSFSCRAGPDYDIIVSIILIVSA